MSRWLVIPAVIAAVVAGGGCLCVVAGVDPHWREALVAAGVCALAGELSMIPIVLTHGATQPAVAQAALVATMVHLFACLALGGTLILLKALGLQTSFVYWLLSLYWATLVALVVVLVREIKHAPAGTTGAK